MTSLNIQNYFHRNQKRQTSNHIWETNPFVLDASIVKEIHAKPFEFERTRFPKVSVLRFRQFEESSSRDWPLCLCLCERIQRLDHLRRNNHDEERD